MDKVKRDALISSQEDLFVEHFLIFFNGAGAIKSGSLPNFN
jgi:hypothetical protein